MSTTHHPDQRSALSLLSLSEADVKQLMDPLALLDALAQGFMDLAEGKFQAPARSQISVPENGFLLTMPAWREGSPIAVKMVSVFEGNAQKGLPSHVAVINLYDQNTGVPLCVMDGTFITGIRTAGAAALSVREIARPDARVATIIGAGVQGREHLRMLPLVRELEQIQVYSLKPEDAETLAQKSALAEPTTDLEAAVRQSDIVCLTSHAYEPVIDPSWVQPGCHVTSVGYAPPHGELPPELARDHTLFVEDAAAFADPPAGCGELQGINPTHGICLGDALLHKQPKRSSESEITVYKAMGIAMEDAVAAELVYLAALAQDKQPDVQL